jgi:membrane protease YdiL (CAAX protease family)
VARYWPAALAIFTLAVVTLVIRVKTGSVLSAIIVHVAYNAVLIAVVYAGKLPV